MNSKPQIVRDGNKAVVYLWSGEKWDYVGEYAGDATGQSNAQVQADFYWPFQHILNIAFLIQGQGKYDRVFEVTVDDGRSLKLNYNNSESPLAAAQRFAAENQIPDDQIPEIVNFIMENAPNAGNQLSSYADPFTG